MIDANTVSPRDNAKEDVDTNWIVAAENSTSSAQLGELLDKGISSSSPQDVRRLTEHPNFTIAIFAEWTLCKGEQKFMPATSIAKFTGFVHGKTGIFPPKEWCCALHRRFGREDDDSQEISPLRLDCDSLREEASDLIPVKFSPDVPAILVPSNIHFELADSELSVRLEGGDQLRTRSNKVLRLFDKDYPSPTSLAVSKGFGRWILVFYDRDFSPGRVCCFDEKTQSLTWINTLWAQGNVSFSQKTGTRHHLVKIAQNQERVAVFATEGLTYVECFDASSGNAILRFLPGFWQWERVPERIRKEYSNRASNELAKPQQ